MDKINKIDKTIQKIQWEADYDVHLLLDKAKGLRNDMDKLITKLTALGLCANINELGEVQSRGYEIDGLCRKIVVQRRILSFMQSYLKEDKK